jgi:hypothetical protein
MIEGLSRSEYYHLLGLKVLADRHTVRLNEIADAVHELLEVAEDEEPGAGHISDTVYNAEFTADELIDRLKIPVEPS